MTGLAVVLAGCVSLVPEPANVSPPDARAKLERALETQDPASALTLWSRARREAALDAGYLSETAARIAAAFARLPASPESAKEDAQGLNAGRRAALAARNAAVVSEAAGLAADTQAVIRARMGQVERLRAAGMLQTAVLQAVAWPEVLRADPAFAAKLRADALSAGNPWLVSHIDRALGVPATENLPALRPSDILKACATVWVDRGTRMEGGIGLPDVVIGSAFFFERSGWLITNHHVIASEVDPDYEGYSRLTVRVGEGQERVPARVVAWDREYDIAILKVEVDAPAIVPLAPNPAPVPGSRVMAFGSPVGLVNTVTAGIASNAGRRLLPMGEVIQIDAPVNHGNSGGPLMAETGEFLGVVFAGLSEFQGINFCVPAATVAAIIPRLACGGNLVQPWLGMRLYEHRSQIRVLYVVPGSPAWSLGVPSGAALLTINGERPTGIGHAYRLLHSLEAGEALLIGWAPSSGGLLDPVRDTAAEIVAAVAAERPRRPLEPAVRAGMSLGLLAALFGFTAEDIGSMGSPQLKVAEVVPGSSADDFGLSTGDIVEPLDWAYDATNGAVLMPARMSRRSLGYFTQALMLTAPVVQGDFL